MNATTKPNAQTPGAVSISPRCGVPGWEDSVCTLRSPCGYVAEVDGGNTPAEARANARLFAAGFNAFDSAGRALGIDAADLAEKLDLVSLIRAARLANVTLAAIAQRGSTLTTNEWERTQQALFAALSTLPVIP